MTTMNPAASGADLTRIRRELKAEQRRLDARRFFRNRQAVVGAVIVLVMLLTALLAPVIAPADPLAQTVPNRFARPGTAGYLLGADKLDNRNKEGDYTADGNYLQRCRGKRGDIVQRKLYKLAHRPLAFSHLSVTHIKVYLLGLVSYPA